MFLINGTPIEVTMFPDRTSQVWKLPWVYVSSNVIEIEWYFDHEGEIMHLVQLDAILNEWGIPKKVLKINYLPYARQDKKISNDTTFALHSFTKLINTTNFTEIQILDPHSDAATMLIKNSIRVSPDDFIRKAINLSNSEIICYPDAGASWRYDIYGTDEVVIDKVRDQSTGQITKTELSLQYASVVKDRSILIVDDICDGGRTFIEAAKLLYEAGAREVNLYVTHGIFSKGLRPLEDAGINRIFTKTGEANETRYGITYTPWEKL